MFYYALLRFILFLYIYLCYVELFNCPFLWNSRTTKANSHVKHLLWLIHFFNNNNNNSYIALYPVNIYKLVAMYIINIKIRLFLYLLQVYQTSYCSVSAVTMHNWRPDTRCYARLQLLLLRIYFSLDRSFVVKPAFGRLTETCKHCPDKESCARKCSFENWGKRTAFFFF